MEDEEGDDTHKLHQLKQAIVKGQPLTIEIRAEYAWDSGVHEAIFSKEFRGMPVPIHIFEPHQAAYKQIEQIGLSYQGGLPQSCVWTAMGLTREQIDVSIVKKGSGVYVRYGFVGSTALDMANLPERIRAELPNDWVVTFGSSESPTDGELTSRLMCITSKVDPTGKQYEFPWQIRLERVQLRTGEEGASAAIVSKVAGSWNDERTVPKPPLCAKEMLTFVESTRPDETQALLRFGRDSNWPLRITVATGVSPLTTLAVTYDSDWDGIECSEEGETSVGWAWSKFIQKAAAENLAVPPSFSRAGVPWQAILRKENNSLRVILKEATIWTPEDPGGPPPMVLFGPSATLKIRTAPPNAL
jgi:hypothetical protein